MKLEGSLDAFGLPDIFQLLSLTKKTGGLHLRSGSSAGVVYFTEGSITGADSDLSRQSLARRVVGSGSVTDHGLIAAIERAQSEGIGVGRALVDSGAADAGTVKTAATEVAFDAVHDLLAWPEGDFAFSPDAVNPDDMGVVLPTDLVVTQAGVRRESLATAADAIPSGDVVLAIPVTPATDPDLSREEWSLVALADGRRTVGEIVDLSGRGSFAVLPALAGLVRRGLLEVRDGDNDPVELVRRRLDLLAPLEGRSAAPSSAPATAPAAVNAPAAVTVVPPPVPAPAPVAPAAEVAAAVEDDAEDAEDADDADVDLEGSYGGELVSTIGGPHVPDNVVPPRPEPFLAPRQPEHPELDQLAPAAARLAFAPSAAGAASASSTAPGPGASSPVGGSVFSQPPSAESPRGSSGGGMSHNVGGVNGSAAMAADPEASALIERDPSVNRSLLLRLIAGVRGL